MSLVSSSTNISRGYDNEDSCQLANRRKKIYTYIGHEFLTCDADLLRESSREHHDLLVVGGCPENFLNVTAHVWWAVSKLDGLVAKQIARKVKVEERK